MAIYEKQPHFLLLPFFAKGHLLPMVDIARLLAKRGVIVTILVTPQNEKRIEGVINRAIDSGLSIRLLQIKLPSIVPEEWENVDQLPSVDEWLELFKATVLLRDQIEEYVKDMKPSPTCLIADMCFPWATDMALKLQIPRLAFHGTSCFALLFFHMLRTSKNFESVASATEYFVVPDLPDRIEITKAQLLGTTQEIPPEWQEIRNQMFDSEEQSFGTVVNTFEELESEYVSKYIQVKGKKVWCIGPVSLCNKDNSDKAERGNKASIDEHECLKWLDSHEPSSVLYVCLGSLARLSASQLIELGLSLEGSNRPFIWVVRSATNEFKTWLSENGFEERVKGRGLLIQGWAPQVLILSHPSVGGFITHCGWNSTLEGVTAGLPMIAWPVFAEQFCNEKFIVNVIKTGIRAGVEMPVMIGQEDNVGVQVKSGDIERVIERLMDGGEEGRERRERARKLGEMARSAVEEEGSSYRNMTRLIQDVVMLQEKRGEEQSGNRLKLEEENSSGIVVQ